MFSFISRFFASFNFWLLAFENLGEAASHVSTVAKESAGAYADEARANRLAKAATAAKDLKQIK